MKPFTTPDMGAAGAEDVGLACAGAGVLGLGVGALTGVKHD